MKIRRRYDKSEAVLDKVGLMIESLPSIRRTNLSDEIFAFFFWRSFFFNQEKIRIIVDRPRTF